IREADYPRARVREYPGRVVADLSEAQDTDSEVFDFNVEVRKDLEHGYYDPEGGRLAPAERAAKRDRLACDYAGNGVALHHGIGVHHPGHHLFVGVHIRRGYIRLRAYEHAYLVGISPGKALQLVLAHHRRVAGDSALCAAKGYVHEGALPGHKRRKRGYLVEVYPGMKADAALGKAARKVVLHAVALKKTHCPVVHLDGDRDYERAPWRAEPFVYAIGKVKVHIRLLK